MVPDREYIMPIGVADIKKAGTDVTIVSFGKMMKIALKAAEELAAENINAEVIDLRTVRPIDYATVINSVKKTNRLVIVEESWPLAAIATEVAFKVQREAFDYLDAPVLRVMGGDVPPICLVIQDRSCHPFECRQSNKPLHGGRSDLKMTRQNRNNGLGNLCPLTATGVNRAPLHRHQRHILCLFWVSSSWGFPLH